MALAALLALAVGQMVSGAHEKGVGGPLDLAGTLSLTAAVMALIVGTTLLAQRGDAGSGGALVAGALAAAVGFATIERRASTPLLPPRMWAHPNWRNGAVGSFLNTATTSSAVVLATLYLQDVLRRGPLWTALTLLPLSLAVIGGARTSARLLARGWLARQVLATGLAVIAAADGLLASPAGLSWSVPLAVAGSGGGIGLASVAATVLGTDVASGLRTMAAGAISTAAQLGTAVGTAFLLLLAQVTNGAMGRAGSPWVGWAAAALAAALGSSFFTLHGNKASVVVLRPTAKRRSLASKSAEVEERKVREMVA